jgi:hypothetical protein
LLDVLLLQGFRRSQPVAAGACACVVLSVIILCCVRLHRFQPPEKFTPFLLGPGLCYNNALENAASAMEVAAVAAKNCVLLVQQHLRQMHAKGPSVHERVAEE